MKRIQDDVSMLVVEQGENKARIGEVQVSEIICKNRDIESRLGLGVSG